MTDRPQTRDPYDPNSFCHTCGKAEGACRRNELSGHEFESATAHARRLAHDGPKPSLRAGEESVRHAAEPGAQEAGQ